MEKERTCLFSGTFAGEAVALLPDIDFLAPMYYHSHQSNTIPEDFRSLSAALRLRVLGSVNLEKYVIQGGCRLTGEVNISGAKNAAVAIIPAVILAEFSGSPLPSHGEHSLAYVLFATLAAVFIGGTVLVKHRANIGRLRRGEEKPVIFGKKK